MATETQLARTQPANLAPAPPNLRAAFEEEAGKLIDSGYFGRFLGTDRKPVTRDQAIINMTTVMLYGREMGFSPIQSLQHIYVVNNLPGLDFQILQALVRKNGRGFVAMWPVKSTNTEAIYHIERHDGPVVQSYDATFTIEDAKRLGLGYYKDGNPIAGSPWQTQPDVMLLRRAGTKAMRELCGDLVQGFNSLDEIGIQVDTVRDREVPIITPEGEPVIEREVLSAEALEEEEVVDAVWEKEDTREANADQKASAEFLKGWKAAVKTHCEAVNADPATVNQWLNERLARMELRSSNDATQLQLEVLYDQLTREYDGN